MKKIIATTVISGLFQLCAQDLSCVQFAMMDATNANSVLKQYKRDMNIKDIKPENLQSEVSYVQVVHKKSEHINTCLLLRDANTNDLTSLERVKALSSLSSKNLKWEEKNLYSKLLNENKNFYRNISKATLTNKSACNKPLVYLSSQMTNKGLLVYEKRLDGSKVKTFSAYIDTHQPLPLQCSINNVNRKYIDYLNQTGANLPSMSEDIYSKDYILQNHTIPVKDVVDTQNYYKAISTFQGVYFSNGQPKTFNAGDNLIYIKNNEEEIFFFYNNIKYRAIKERFQKNTIKMKDRR